VIRPRTAADLDACVLALRAVHEEGGYPLNWPRDPAAWLDPPGVLAAWIWVSPDDPGEIAGHVLVTSPGMVNRLFVAPAHRGRGIGAQLLAEVRQWAAARHLDLRLDVIDRSRSAAIALYERTGWIYERTDAADWKDPSGEPVHVRIYSLPCPA
jgi:GNAT superfamily N-acetyltransferase